MNFFNFCTRDKHQKKAVDTQSLNEYISNQFNVDELEKITMFAILQQVSYYPILFWNKDWKRRYKKIVKKREERNVRSRRISLDSFEIGHIYEKSDFQEINLFSMPTSREVESPLIKKIDSIQCLLSFEENKDKKEYIIPYSNISTHFIDAKYELDTFPNKPFQYKIINEQLNVEFILTIFITNQEVIFIPNIYCRDVISYKNLRNVSDKLLEDLMLKEEFTKFIINQSFPEYFSFIFVGHHTSIFLTKGLYQMLKKSFNQYHFEMYLFQPLIFDDNNFWNDIFRIVQERRGFILSFDSPSEINSAYIKYIHFILLEWVETIPSLNQEQFDVKKCRDCYVQKESGLSHKHCCFVDFFQDIPNINRKRNIRAFVHLLCNPFCV